MLSGVYERIVVGVNPVDSAQRAAKEAIALAEAVGADLHLVCAYAPEPVAPLSSMVAGAALATATQPQPAPRPDATRAHVENFLSGLARSTSVTTHRHVLPGDPAESILQVCGEVGADLVVVGNKGMQGARRVLGSVPNTVSHQAPCSVLIVSTT
jgi:nucleotide-binding universal stress UspA family protein